MACKIDLNGVSIIEGCPPDSSKILLFGVTGQPNELGFITYASLRDCLVCSIFGIGALEIIGSELDSEGVYLNSGLVDNLMIFACNIPNYLEEETQWEYVLNVDNEVVGVKILIGYEDSDRFIIIPNPICT